jgi:hypothetical protein
LNKPLSSVEIAHFNDCLSYDHDTVVRCPKCGRTQYLKLQWGIENGWSECCDIGIMPIIYYKASHKAEDDLLAGIRVYYLRKEEFVPKDSEV